MERRTRLTYRYEKWRAVSSGVIESAGTTFLLLLAVQHFNAGATSKALVVSGGSAGLILSPLLVKIAGINGWPTAKAASWLSAIGAAAFLLTAVFPILPLFVVCSMVAMATSTAVIPLLTQIYQENYPQTIRGQLFSRTIVIRIATTALFSEMAGRLLSLHEDGWRLLLIIFGAAFLLAANWLRKYPDSELKTPSGGKKVSAARLAWEDPLFRRTLICWMLMGFANLMMAPMRIEYMANPRYGVNLSIGEIAFLTGVLPNMVRLLLSPAWGWLFDHVNFFVLRVVLNCGFALGIMAFFMSSTLEGFILGSIIFGVSVSGGDVAWSLWVTKFAPSDRVADYMSVHTFLTGVRGVIAPLAGFHLVKVFSMREVGAGCILLILLASVLLIPEIRANRRRDTIDAVVEEALD